MLRCYLYPEADCLRCWVNDPILNRYNFGLLELFLADNKLNVIKRRSEKALNKVFNKNKTNYDSYKIIRLDIQHFGPNFLFDRRRFLLSVRPYLYLCYMDIIDKIVFIHIAHNVMINISNSVYSCTID